MSERTVTNLLDRYDELKALAVADPGRLRPLLERQGRVVLAIDGLQPDVGHEVLWVLRDCIGGTILLARSLLSAKAADLSALLTEVRRVLPVPVTGVVSDGQGSIRKAVARALPGVPHQLCHFHYLREAARPISEADRHAKKELKKRVRGVRQIERAAEEGDDPEAEVVRGYCAAVRAALPGVEIDARKEDYLRRTLVPFPLKPHWLTETRHGFHLLFRVQPLRGPNAVREAEEVNRRLVLALRGDPNAALLTQLLRVPGTLQFKVPSSPFLCRLLVDNAPTIAPYSLDDVRSVLGWWGQQSPKDAFSLAARSNLPASDPQRWREGLSGVAKGQRNATAAALVGKLLRWLPEELWETGGWGGVKEWNGRNRSPLPERELRSVFESIARREKSRRRTASRAPAAHRAEPSENQTDSRPPSSVPDAQQ